LRALRESLPVRVGRQLFGRARKLRAREGAATERSAKREERLIFRTELKPLESRGDVRPAFEAISEVQQKAAVTDWYVPQPDHCRISGELAAALDCKRLNLREPVVRAIAMHDVGWMPYDGDANSPIAPGKLEFGQPLSFINAQPERFLRAWMGSIQAAQSTGPLGGMIVSGHFARLARMYLERGAGTPEQREQVEQFQYREAARMYRLLPAAGLPLEEIEKLVTVLQFCDLASLYLCANPAAPVELPQVINGRRARFSFEQGIFRLNSNLLDHALALEIPCIRFVDRKPERELVPVKVQ